MDAITQALDAIEQGNPQAAEQLLPLVYDELRRLAAQKLAGEKPGQTLQATALVHEAYARLVGSAPNQAWDGRSHFFAAAAEAMRRILIDRARHKNSRKAGGGRRRVDLNEIELTLDEPDRELLALDDALREFEQKAPRKAAVVKLRFFAGLTTAQAAAALGVSTSTAENDWAYARSWLRLRMGEPGGDPP
jgi:RNA polymerase sigma factor (TIGR02999 family)